MQLETERLLIIPLNAAQLRLWTENLSALEAELDCSYCAEPMKGFFPEIVKGQIPIAEQDAANYLWHTFWFIARKSDRVAVGSAYFKGTPNADTEVEIGYGLGPDFTHDGYMTEAVLSMCDWTLQQSGVST